ncbi:MAG TPA: hypothetical protein VLG37_04390 [Candidatus Saccharimonadales bacterium]|nr:hypothetical protein [Candidatus Saccharimonadales bacterium]
MDRIYACEDSCPECPVKTLAMEERWAVGLLLRDHTVDEINRAAPEQLKTMVGESLVQTDAKLKAGAVPSIIEAARKIIGNQCPNYK